MQTCHFDRSLLPPARTFFERELGKLSRPDRKGNCRAACPFHDSRSKKSLSVNIITGEWWCFGVCNEGGDMVRFVMKRYRLDFPAACKYLGAWRGEGLSPSEKRQITAEQCQHQREVEEMEAQRRQRIDVRDFLHAVERLYSEAIAEHDWWMMSEMCERVRQMEQTYWQSCGLEVRHEA